MLHCKCLFTVETSPAICFSICLSAYTNLKNNNEVQPPSWPTRVTKPNLWLPRCSAPVNSDWQQSFVHWFLCVWVNVRLWKWKRQRRPRPGRAVETEWRGPTSQSPKNLHQTSRSRACSCAAPRQRPWTGIDVRSMHCVSLVAGRVDSISAFRKCLRRKERDLRAAPTFQPLRLFRGLSSDQCCQVQGQWRGFGNRPSRQPAGLTLQKALQG